VQDFSIYWNAFWLKVRAGQLGLVRLPAANVEVFGGLIPTGYRWILEGTGKTQDFAPSEIVHFRGYDPSNPLQGRSPIETLRRVLRSAGDCAREAGVKIVTGDTKVVERGAGFEIFINTSGVGVMRTDLDFTAGRIAPGDALIVNGPVGDHGIAVVSVREGLQFAAGVQTDAAPLAEMVGRAVDACGAAIKCMKDPTRGGLAANINEMAQKVGFVLDENTIPVRPAVRGACELLGFDVLTVANEGKMLFAVSPEAADEVLRVLRSHPLGHDAAVIGHADERAGSVRLRTAIGGERIVETPYGENLPRIC